MIHVERGHDDAVALALSKRGQDRMTECERAIWFYAGERPARPADEPQFADTDRPSKPPKFAAYKSEAVKQALYDMFKGRCAYCETLYAANAPPDIEHYRPKGAYLDEQGQLVGRGYYWLAAAWENLLPSCVDCNRERKQVHRTADGALVKRKSGKANQFPLAAGSPRAEAPGAHMDERPLLLDPCGDRPRLHLHFRPDGWIEPASTRAEARLPKGLTTIGVCGLARAALVEKRHAVAIRVRDAIQRICECDVNVRAEPETPRFRQQRHSAEGALQNLLTKSPEYLALTRTLVRAFARARAAAGDYHDAVAAWQAGGRSVALKADIEAAVARIRQMTSPAACHAEFVQDVFDYLEVPRVEPD